MQTSSKLLRIQKRIYQSIQREISLAEAPKDREILQYEIEYKKIFSKLGKTCQRETLIRALKKSALVLVGDFHPFPQSQKAFLRLLPLCDVDAIALECVRAKDQKSLDAYQNNALSLEELREDIDFDNFWPFSWESYKQIIQYAKEKKIKLIALNYEPSKKTSSLDARDEFAASILQKACSQYKKVFVLYGELHLAPKRLPEKLKSIPHVLLLQNEARIYWKFHKQISKQKTEIIQLSPKTFCILNSVPWVKMQAYLDWLEGSPAEDDLSHSESSEHVYTYFSMLEGLLGPCPGSPMEEITFYDSHAENLFIKQKDSLFTTSFLRHLVDYRRTFFIPTAKIAYLATHNPNSHSELAAQIYGSTFQAPHSLERVFKNPFWGLVLWNLRGYLGSKWVNPKRKCNELSDLKDLNKDKRRNKKQKLAIQLAIAQTEYVLGLRTKPASYKNLPFSQLAEAARMTGYLYAERLFHAYLNKKIPDNVVMCFFSTPFSEEEQIERELRRRGRAFLRQNGVQRKNDKF